jgi:hypothetical protein
VINFGSDEMKKTVVPAVLSGEKFISLAITEPGAGSDVANLSTRAEDAGDHFVLNGEKKWITQGGKSGFEKAMANPDLVSSIPFFILFFPIHLKLMLITMWWLLVLVGMEWAESRCCWFPVTWKVSMPAPWIVKVCGALVLPISPLKMSRYQRPT